MAKPEKPDAQLVREASAILDEMERNPPSEESLAPFRTKNWIRKGEGMLAGLKPIGDVLILAVLLGGCTQAQLAAWAPGGGPHSTTFTRDGAVRTYHYPAARRDPLGSVHEFRPDLYHNFYGPH